MVVSDSRHSCISRYVTGCRPKLRNEVSGKCAPLDFKFFPFSEPTVSDVTRAWCGYIHMAVPLGAVVHLETRLSFTDWYVLDIYLLYAVALQ